MLSSCIERSSIERFLSRKNICVSPRRTIDSYFHTLCASAKTIYLPVSSVKHRMIESVVLMDHVFYRIKSIFMMHEISP